MRIAVLGEVLWDIVNGCEHLGGAPFNFAVNAHRLGHEVLFVSGVGSDVRGEAVLSRMRALELCTSYVTRVAERPTGTVSVNVDPSGLPTYVIHRPAAYDFPALDDSGLRSLTTPSPDWICYGTLQQLSSAAHDVLLRVLARAPHARRFYDVNLRRDSYHPALVRQLLGHASVLKLNEEEAGEFGKMVGIGCEAVESLESFCRECKERFELEAVCVTRGAAGCVLLAEEYVDSPGYPVSVADTIGAGDAFSAVLVHGLGTGWPPARIADLANRLGALVASRPGALPEWSPAELQALEARGRSR